MKFKTLLVLLMVGILLTACSTASKVVGDWVATDGTAFSFYKDGTVSIDSLGFTITGTYEFVDKDTMRLELDGLWGIAGASIYDVSVKGSELTLSDGIQAIILQKD